MWKKKSDFGGTVRHRAVGFSIGDNGYIGTGYISNSSSEYVYYKDFWEYTPEFPVSVLPVSPTLSDLSFSMDPNPSKDFTTIQFTITLTSNVNIKLFDVSGKEMRTIVNSEFQEGPHSLQLKTCNFPKGIYFVRMITEDGIQTQKLVVQ